MKLVLFEDDLWYTFAPIVYSRPLFSLRCGAFTLQERLLAFVERYSGLELTTPSSSSDGSHNGLCNPSFENEHFAVHGICRSHLMGCHGPTRGIGAFLSRSEPILFVNARVLRLDWLPYLLEAPVGTAFCMGDTLIGARLSPALATTIVYYLYEQQVRYALEELKRFARVQEIETPLLSYPWDLVAVNGEQLVDDIPLLQQRLPAYNQHQAQAHDPSITIRGDEHLYVAPSAKLEGPLVLDSRDGPIFIDEGAHIEPFSFIQGPAYIGKRTLISSSLIRGETSIGPVCRIGGEVEASIVQGFSNKHHDGFLGHSWLGEWVNIGAMTTNSDLKNTYGNVRVAIDGIGNLDSGQMKLGAFLADHVKLGIGIHLTGGSVIGVASNIFGVHMSPKTVPPFTWGGEVFREFRIDSMINVARKVMGRRRCEMSDAYEEMLRTVFAQTHESRVSLRGIGVTQSRPSPTSQGNIDPTLLSEHERLRETVNR